MVANWGPLIPLTHWGPAAHAALDWSRTVGVMTKEHMARPALRALILPCEQEAGSSGDFPSWLAYPVPWDQRPQPGVPLQLGAGLGNSPQEKAGSPQQPGVQWVQRRWVGGEGLCKLTQHVPGSEPAELGQGHHSRGSSRGGPGYRL